MKKYGFVWPERMNCDTLPDFGDPRNLCMDYKNGSLPPGPQHSPPQVIPNLPGPSLPPTNDQNPHVPSLPKQCTCSCRDPFVRIKPSSPMRGLGISVAGIPECGFPCNGSAYFSDAELVFADSWISSWAIFCFVSTLLTLTTFCIDTERFKYPERATIVLSGCYLMVSLGYVSRFYKSEDVYTDYRYEPRTSPLSCFASTNS
jgi:frizzled protein 5/8